MHDVYNDDGEITERRSSSSEIGEGGVAWGVDDQQAGETQLFARSYLKTQKETQRTHHEDERL